jgi:hypothetical protein
MGRWGEVEEELSPSNFTFKIAGFRSKIERT